MLRLSSRWCIAATGLCLQRETLKLVQELRFRSDAPISDCNTALKECNFNMEAAIEWLKKKGIAKASKKEGRVTENGVVIAAVDRSYGGAIVSLCCETDFGSRSEYFATTAKTVQECMLKLIAESSGEIIKDSTAAFDALNAKCNADVFPGAKFVLGENITLKAVTPIPFPSAEVEGEEVRSLPLRYGKYTHNASFQQDVGSIVGLVAVRQLASEAPAISNDSLDELAQHFVGSSGDTSSYVHQSFLGSSDTVGQWLKKNNVKLTSSFVMNFGKEPIVNFPAVRRQPHPAAPKQ